MALKRPHWRKGTWIILIFNLLMLVWMISAGGATGSALSDCAQYTDEFERAGCEAGTAIGAGLGAGMLIGLWVAGDVILGVIWLVTNKKKTRDCPVCGADVKKGLTVCGSCGHDFAAGLRTQGA
jgi:hypothetical protein